MEGAPALAGQLICLLLDGSEQVGPHDHGHKDSSCDVSPHAFIPASLLQACAECMGCATAGGGPDDK